MIILCTGYMNTIVKDHHSATLYLWIGGGLKFEVKDTFVTTSLTNLYRSKDVESHYSGLY